MNLRLAALFVVLIPGCASSLGRSKVTQQASFDHNCPEEKIQVVSENTSIWAYRLNVCGTERKYRDRGGDKTFQFVDVTSDPGATPAPEGAK